MTTRSWTSIGTVDDIPREGARVVRTSKGDVAIFHTSAGDIFALEDRCPHLGGPLSQGIVHGGSVTCPLHNLVIDLATGGVLGPEDGCARVVPVRLRDGEIEIDLDGFIMRTDTGAAKRKATSRKVKRGKAAA